MLLSIVTSPDVLNIEHAAAVCVNHLERLTNQRFPPLVHRSHNLLEELVVDDLAVLVGVERIENGLDLQGVARYTVALECLCKLLTVQVARVVVVHYFKRLSQAEDASGAACLNALSHPLDQFSIGHKRHFFVLFTCAAVVTLALNHYALICRKVKRVAATCRPHRILNHFALAHRPCSLIWHVVSNQLVLNLAVENFMVLVLPLLA